MAGQRRRKKKKLKGEWTPKARQLSVTEERRNAPFNLGHKKGYIADKECTFKDTRKKRAHAKGQVQKN